MAATGFVELESYFPFDPYLLKESSRHIVGIYNQWRGTTDSFPVCVFVCSPTLSGGADAEEEEVYSESSQSLSSTPNSMALGRSLTDEVYGTPMDAGTPF
jgi:hypothetical protein